MKNKFVIIFFIIGFFAAPKWSLAAANLFLNPGSASYVVGNNFSISVRVNSGGTAINAARATLNFDTAKLRVNSVSTSGSIFTLWAEAPSYSNTNGTISFSGGLPSPGYSGTSGIMITVNFAALSTGSTTISFSGGQVLANDGVGTDILGTTSSGSYSINHVPLSASCTAAPNPVSVGQSVTYSAQASGGASGNYSYTWSNACTGSSATCVQSFSSAGTKTANLVVSDGSETVTKNCSTVVNWPSLSVTCSSTATFYNSNETVSYSAAATGGDGNFAYSWSGDCSSNSSGCSASYVSTGLKQATVTVTSGNASAASTCSIYIGPACPATPTCSSSGCPAVTCGGVPTRVKEIIMPGKTTVVRETIKQECPAATIVQIPSQPIECPNQKVGAVRNLSTTEEQGRNKYLIAIISLSVLSTALFLIVLGLLYSRRNQTENKTQ